MKPFTAWLAMGQILPALYACESGYFYKAFSDETTANFETTTKPQPVIVIPDTPENRKILGMEEK